MFFFELMNLLLISFLCLGMILVYSGVSRKKNALSPFLYGLLLTSSLFTIWSLVEAPILKISDLINGLFFVLVPLIILGAVLERVRWVSLIVMLILWTCTCYYPIWIFMVKTDGLANFIGDNKFHDFAGGIYIHLPTGIAGLVFAKMVGRRKDFFSLIKPSNLLMVGLGSFFILIGWNGFNLSSVSSLNLELVTKVILNTSLSGGLGFLLWSLLDIIHTPHRVSISSGTMGLVAGLVSITPIADIISTVNLIWVVSISVVITHYSSKYLIKVFKIDDVLSVFSTHAVSGVISSLVWLTVYNDGEYFKGTLFAIALISTYVVFTSILIAFLTSKFLGLRCKEDFEAVGLDITDFKEAAWHND